MTPIMLQPSAILNQEYTLSDLEFTLSHDLEEGKVEKGLIMLKHVPSKKYMLVSSEQLLILKRFRKPLRVARLVPTLIEDRKCPPLRELYELILQCLEKGILESEKIQPTSTRAEASEWNLKLHLKMGKRFAILSIIFGLTSLYFSDLRLPFTNSVTTWYPFALIIAGYLAICGAISLGYFLSACLLRGFNHEVYDVCFNWKNLFPHFYVDISDACMSGRHREASIALVQLAPIFLFSGIIAFVEPQIMFILVLGIFQATQPHRNSSGWLLLESLFRRKTIDTDKQSYFAEAMSWKERWAKRFKTTDKKFIFISSLYTVAWASAFGYFFLRLFNIPLTAYIKTYVERGYHWNFFVFILTILLLCGIYICIQWFKSITKTSVPLRKKKADLYIDSVDNPDLTLEEVVYFLKDCLLFQDLSEDELSEVAEHLELRYFEKKKFVLREGEVDTELHIIASGRVEMMMALKSGRPVRIAELGAGEIFAERAAILGTPSTRSIRTLTPTWCLVMKTDDFKQLILKRVSRQRLSHIAEKQYFLYRIDLCKEWTAKTMADFAYMANFSEYKAGEYILTKGISNKFFYIVYEGIIEFQKNGKAVKRLRSGDCFGEVGLLENSVRSNDVVSVTDTRCLVVSRADFLNMLGKDYHFGLQFERIASKRLKRPVFPLKQGINYSDAALR